MNKRIISFVLILFLGSLLGCAYFNTFFNAKKRYEQAEKKQKNSKSVKVAPDAKKDFMAAIKKSWKLIDFYGDSSKYADDALLLIGKSHFNLQEYLKAERVLEQFIKKYNTSELVPEAKLWLAKTYIGLEKDGQALEILNTMFKSKVSKKIAAQAFYILGDLYYKQGDYKKAITQLEKCIKIAPDDEMEGNARFLIGEAFYDLEEYENAIFNYEKLKSLDVPPIKEFDARMQIAEALIKLKKYEDAELRLKNMLRDLRFQKQFSLIETKLGNLYEIQGDPQFAMDQYYDILRKYPKNEGAILASFYIAQLYEHEFTNFDSAAAYYKRVTRLQSNPELEKEAKERAALLKEYLKIRNQLRKDRSDLWKLSQGDSIIEDSVEAPGQKEAETETVTAPQATDALQAEDVMGVSKAKESPQNKALSKKKKTKKVAVSRTEPQIQASLKKNSFALGEYFLLKYEQPDSAESAYKNFIANFDDSLLTPKSYYALYVIYQSYKEDSLKADSIRQIILNRYPTSVYGLKLSGREDLLKKKETGKNPFKVQYNQAENLMFAQKFRKAVALFKNIAAKDSGSTWAEKARYATAYVYEHFLHDTSSAIAAYQQLAKEYPKSKLGLLAKKKTEQPKAAEKPAGKETLPAKTTGHVQKNEQKKSKLKVQIPAESQKPKQTVDEKKPKPKPKFKVEK